MKPFWRAMLVGLGVGIPGQSQAAETQPAPAAPAPSPVIKRLEEATKDLEMPSETDAPFRVFFLPTETVKPQMTPEEWAQSLELKSQVFKEKRELAAFFDASATEEEWMDDEEKLRAKRLANLRDLIAAEIKDPAVYLFGEGEMEVVVVGEITGGWAGVITLIVET